MWTDYWVIGRGPSINTCRDSHCSRKVDPLGWSWHPLPSNVKIRKNRSAPGNAISSYQDPHSLSLCSWFWKTLDGGGGSKLTAIVFQCYIFIWGVICLIHFDNAYTCKYFCIFIKAVPSKAKYLNSKSKQQQQFFFLNYIILCILVCFTFKMFDPYGWTYWYIYR